MFQQAIAADGWYAIDHDGRAERLVGFLILGGDVTPLTRDRMLIGDERVLHESEFTVDGAGRVQLNRPV